MYKLYLDSVLNGEHDKNTQHCKGYFLRMIPNGISTPNKPVMVNLLLGSSYRIPSAINLIGEFINVISERYSISNTSDISIKISSANVGEEFIGFSFSHTTYEGG